MILAIIDLELRHGQIAAHIYIAFSAWRGAFSAVFKFVYLFDISHLDLHAAYQSQTGLYSRLGIAKEVRIIVDIVSARRLGGGNPVEAFYICPPRALTSWHSAGCIYFHALS